MPPRHLSAMPRTLPIKALTNSFSFCVVERRVGMETSESSSKNLIKKRLSKSLNVLIDPGGSFKNQSKAYPLREPTNSLVKIVSFMAMFPV